MLCLTIISVLHCLLTARLHQSRTHSLESLKRDPLESPVERDVGMSTGCFQQQFLFIDVDDVFRAKDSEPIQPALRAWHEDPDWISELADCLHFRELLRYRFSKQGHINVLECRTYKTWLKYASKHFAGCRLLGLLDSRVTLGATAKGRSSSFALSRVLQGSLGYVIGALSRGPSCDVK